MRFSSKNYSYKWEIENLGQSMQHQTIDIAYFEVVRPYILKANSTWSPTWAKFCQLLARLSAILPQHNLTKLKLECLKYGFMCKKEKKHKNFFLYHSSSTFFQFSSSLLLDTADYSYITFMNIFGWKFHHLIKTRW